MEAAQAALDGATLKAPFDGTVLEVMARVGELVMPSRGVALLANIQAVEVRSTVIEEDLSLVQVGQPVELYFDAQPDLMVAGHVARIVPQRTVGDRALYPIYIALDQPAPGLLPGMTADTSIVVAQRQAVTVEGDPTQLRCALGNLLDNACKFTPEGGAVSLGLRAEGGWLEVAVEDTGIGIPEGELPHLFSRFHRGRNAAGYPGNGLGLAIVRAIAEAHGGEVRAENTGHGARFTLRLPRRGN